MSELPSEVSVYIHWPFCVSKCPYCDFNSHVAQRDIDLERWVKAYCAEIDYFFAQTHKKIITSIYFGGGTPSLMDPVLVKEVLQHLEKKAAFATEIEITLEANPNSAEWEKFSAFRAAGINRVSLGVQSLNDEALVFLGRAHKAAQAIEAIAMARDVFDRYSFDLIYGRPQQTNPMWENELREALELSDGHMSLYQLTIEKGTPFYRQFQLGDFVLPEDDVLADMYELTERIMSEYGYHAYEVSNYARVGQESRHNMHYWQYDDYLGIGPGAHGRYVNGEGRRIASMTVHAPYAWLERIEEQGIGIQQERVIDDDEAVTEMLMMSLRLKNGINKEAFIKRFGQEVNKSVNVKALQQCMDQGLVYENATHIGLTFRGRMVCNAILERLL